MQPILRYSAHDIKARFTLEHKGIKWKAYYNYRVFAVCKIINFTQVIDVETRLIIIWN